MINEIIYNNEVINITTETITFNIDSDLKMELKIKALKNKKTITEILTEYIEEYIKD